MTVTRRKVFEDAAAAFGACPSLDNYARMRRALELYAQSDAAVEHAQCTAAECSFANLAQQKRSSFNLTSEAVPVGAAVPLKDAFQHTVHVAGTGEKQTFACPGCKSLGTFLTAFPGCMARCPQCGDVTLVLEVAHP